MPTELETLDQLWQNHRIRLDGPFPDVVIVQDHGAGVESVWDGQGWTKHDAKRYPTLKAAFADLPTVLQSKLGKFDTFVKCAHCGLLIWHGAMPEMRGIAIPGNHEPVECEGVALPSETAVCPGSGMLGQIVQEAT